MPTPLAEQDWDGWLYWTPLSIHNAVASGTEVSRGFSQSVIVDSKAMRKLDEGDVIYATSEVVEVGTATADLFFDCRVLLALP